MAVADHGAAVHRAGVVKLRRRTRLGRGRRQASEFSPLRAMNRAVTLK